MSKRQFDELFEVLQQGVRNGSVRFTGSLLVTVTSPDQPPYTVELRPVAGVLVADRLEA